jgi:hypothetical protein
MYPEMGKQKINEWKKISPTRSEEMGHLKYTAFAVSWFIDAATQINRKKKSLFYGNFKGLEIKKTAYCTERFNKHRQFSWPYSFVEVCGPW